MRPAVLHLGFDGLHAQIEQRRNPLLRGRPVVVGSLLVDSCTYEARRFGIAADTPVALARRLCPHVTVVEGNPHSRRCFTDLLWKIARRRIPSLEIAGDEAFGELPGGWTHPLSAGRELRREIRDELGLVASVGIASNAMVARLACDSVKPDGLVFVPQDDEELFVARRPVEGIVGLGAATRSLLRRLNVEVPAGISA